MKTKRYKLARQDKYLIKMFYTAMYTARQVTFPKIQQGFV